MPAAVLKTGPKAEEMALPAWFCLEILSGENDHGLGVILSQHVLPSVICVTKLLDIVGNLCHVVGEPKLKKRNFQLAKRAETKAIRKKAEKETKQTSKKVQQRN